MLVAANYPTFDLANYSSELVEKGDDPLHPFLDAQLAANLKHEVIAGHLNGLGHIHHAVVAPVLAIDPYRYEPQVLDSINIKDENLEAVKTGMLKMAQSSRQSRWPSGGRQRQ